MPDIYDIKRIAEIEFSDIVKNTFFIDHKLRIILNDNSFLDIHLSQRLPDRFGFHWERMNKFGTIYRYDNFPDKKWENIPTFPYHFHKELQENAEESPFPLTVIEGFRAFMEFVRTKMSE